MEVEAEAEATAEAVAASLMKQEHIYDRTADTALLAAWIRS